MIQAYYSMFHAARALLYSEGYRARSHAACLAVAIEALFVEKKRLPPVLLRAFRKTMALRADADYQAEFSTEGAEGRASAAPKGF